MKTINETFEDKEHKMLSKQKGKLSWHDYILLLAVHAQESIKRGDLQIGNKN